MEPHPANCSRLRANIAVNRADATIIEAAAGDSSGQTPLAIPVNGDICDVASTAPSFSRALYDLQFKTMVVRQTRLDDEIEQLGASRVDLIKIDAETAELSVLRGAIATMRRHRPVVIAEILNRDVLASEYPDLAHLSGSDDAHQVARLFRDLGYTAYAVGHSGLLQVSQLNGLPDGDCNYLFAPARDLPPYISLDSPAWPATLLP